ncbi:MAG: SOS response-associated peptidase [Elusimicrobia bacterium]|nr:SOS response-associated peptidase [Elusimicrobiota bacterium]
MCGRYSRTANVKELQERFGFIDGPTELAPRYNVAPSQETAVVVEQEGRRLRMFRWGLIPSWAKDMAIGYKMINARADTIMEKTSYKRPFATQRCLVLADGFYEWQHLPGAKKGVPMRVALKSREPFAMAGIWDAWKKPDGTEVRSFAVITTDAAKSITHIHDRMPVILERDSEEVWLDPSVQTAALLALLRPYPDLLLESFHVSDLVNSPKNDVPACLEPTAAPAAPEVDGAPGKPRKPKRRKSASSQAQAELWNEGEFK